MAVNGLCPLPPALTISKQIYTQLEKEYSVGERGIIPDLWCQEVSPATVWEKVYTGDRPQTLDSNPRPKEGCPVISSRQIAVLGSTTL